MSAERSVSTSGHSLNVDTFIDVLFVLVAVLFIAIVAALVVATLMGLL